MARNWLLTGASQRTSLAAICPEGSVMNNDEIIRVQTYLRLKFQNDMLTLKRGAKDDMVEVFLEDEFIGTMFRDDDEGDISYSFNMAILEFDLPTI